MFKYPNPFKNTVGYYIAVNVRVLSIVFNKTKLYINSLFHAQANAPLQTSFFLLIRWYSFSLINFINMHKRSGRVPKWWIIIPFMFLMSYFISKLHVLFHCQIARFNTRGWHPPPFWYAVFRGDLDGTQYAKGRYAVRRNSVISYADIIFTLKRSNFH